MQVVFDALMLFSQRWALLLLIREWCLLLSRPPIQGHEKSPMSSWRSFEQNVLRSHPLLFWSCRDWVEREGDRKCNAINFPWWLSRCALRDSTPIRSLPHLELQWENIFFSEFLPKTAVTKCLWTYCFETHQRKIMLRGTSNSSAHHYTPFSPASTVMHFPSAGISLQNVSVQAVWPHRLSFSSTY